MAKAQKQQDTTPQQDPGFERLNAFTGKWKIHGDQLASDFGPAAKVTATEDYEWLQGDKFLIHRLEGKLGDNDMACVEIIGQDAANETYTIETFYNNGMKMKWNLHEKHPGAWLITGDWPHKNSTVKVRCAINFTEDGRSNTAKWESQKHDSSWATFWDLKAEKA